MSLHSTITISFFFLNLTPKDRLLSSLADLTALCIYVAISPTVRESAALIARGDLREVEHFRQFQAQAAAMQSESIRWIYSVAPSMFKPSHKEELHFLHKVKPKNLSNLFIQFFY